MSTKIVGDGDITGATNVFITGDFSYKIRATAPAGWLALNGSVASIGKAGSSAGVANDTVKALFFLWWADFADATLPILTSAGGASTRGASAQADWDALKRLTVFDETGVFTRGSGTGHANGVLQAATEIFDNFTAAGILTLPISGTTTNNTDGITTKTMTYAQGAATTTQAAASLNMSKVRPLNRPKLACVKL